MKKVIRIIVIVLGVLIFLMSTVWFLQGINILPGSVMTGQMKWAINGGIGMVIGVVLIVAANWKRKK